MNLELLVETLDRGIYYFFITTFQHGSKSKAWRSFNGIHSREWLSHPSISVNRSRNYPFSAHHKLPFCGRVFCPWRASAEKLERTKVATVPDLMAYSYSLQPIMFLVLSGVRTTGWLSATAEPESALRYKALANFTLPFFRPSALPLTVLRVPSIL